MLSNMCALGHDSSCMPKGCGPTDRCRMAAKLCSQVVGMGHPTAGVLCLKEVARKRTVARGVITGGAWSAAGTEGRSCTTGHRGQRAHGCRSVCTVGPGCVYLKSAHICSCALPNITKPITHIFPGPAPPACHCVPTAGAPGTVLSQWILGCS